MSMIFSWWGPSPNFGTDTDTTREPTARETYRHLCDEVSKAKAQLMNVESRINANVREAVRVQEEREALRAERDRLQAAVAAAEQQALAVKSRADAELRLHRDRQREERAEKAATVKAQRQASREQLDRLHAIMGEERARFDAGEPV